MKRLLLMVVALITASTLMAVDKAKVANAPIHTMKDLLAFASQQVGKPYALEAVGPEQFDEGGLVQYVFLQAGYELPTDSKGLLKSGKVLKKAKLMMKGDVVILKGQDGKTDKTCGIVTNVKKDGNFDFIIASPEGVSVKNSSSMPFYKGVRITSDKDMKKLIKRVRKGTEGIAKANEKAEKANEEAAEAEENVQKAQKKAEQAAKKAEKAEKKAVKKSEKSEKKAILYEKNFNDTSDMYEYDINQGTLTSNGYQLSAGQVLKLNKYYSLGYRTVKYLVKFGSSGGTATFKSNSGDTVISVDYTNGTFNLNGLSLVSIPNFDNSHQYLIAITKNYQDQIVSVTDVYTGATTSHTYTRNGTGGKGQGAVGTEIITGMQYDYYMMTVTSGSDQILLKEIIVEAGKYDLFLTMYGDSITEPEGYYPTVDFSKAWTQLFVANCAGKAICSGRGGTTINQIMTRISNELPFIRSKYVMITIGTNGGNTYENLCELVEYIQSLGSTAILNHIPCNESGTQVAVNAVIDQVRARYGIKGVDFDKATSLAEDGVTVDTDKMWWENISESQNIYHHPNVLGSAAMYARARIDCPELFNS